MARTQIGDQIIDYDRELTERAYAEVKSGDAERCGCAYCRNFVARRQSAFPTEFRELLSQLGIDAAKEGEVYDNGGDESLRIYGGWFYFAGELIKAGERLTELASDFQYWFVDAKRLPKPPADFGPQVLAVEFYLKLPWVLQEKPDS